MRFATTGTTFRGKALVALAMIAATLVGGCATPQPTATAMRDGGITLPPRGWLEYCERNGTDPSCKIVQLDDRHWRELEQVQASLRSVHKESDQKRFGRAEYWAVADKKGGDCEDIALAARQRLLADGWPASALRLATAWTEQKEYHVVLTVDAARGAQRATYVLDSRFAVVMSWNKLTDLGYRFTSRQSTKGPSWVVVRS